jgi:hypothetical protein
MKIIDFLLGQPIWIYVLIALAVIVWMILSFLDAGCGEETEDRNSFKR